MMPPEANDKNKRAALIVATVSSFIGPFMGSSVNVALPSIGQQFSLGAVQLGWVNNAFLLAAAMFLIPFGRLSDIYGRKKIYLWGVIVFTFASILIANSVSGTMLILCRVVQGFGSSMIFATGMPILISVFPVGERGKALGISVAAVYLGLSTGPFFGGIITQHLGWRYIFWLNLPLGLLLLAVVLFMLKGDWAEDREAKFDFAGSFILGLAILATMYGFSTLRSVPAGGLVALGLGGLMVFIRYELRIKNPVIDVNLFRYNMVFAFSNLAALINYAATFAVSFLLSLYLQKLRGLTPQEAGLVLIVQPIVQAVFSPIAGRMSDRIEPRTVASLGMTLTLVGLILLIFVDEATAMSYIIVTLIILGLGFALFSSPNTNAIMSSVERRFYGVSGALVSAMRQIGMMVSMGIVMFILALVLGQAEIEPAYFRAFIKSMKIAFIIFAMLCFGGIFASLARGKMNHQKS
ncbi:MAG: MFS transporter [candidate division Zixibacteria bacterium]|nr:MFS transporter [candidate division Zixibacteria bacterium]MDD5425763.1 MFS transporter [candidate division Zixibacteria bacterium]